MIVYEYFIKECVSPVKFSVIEEVVDTGRGAKVSILVCLYMSMLIKAASVPRVSLKTISSVKRTLEVQDDEDEIEVSVVV